MERLTLGKAAKEAKRAKSTISKAITLGKLSAIKLEDGSFSIDKEELLKVFPLDDKIRVMETSFANGSVEGLSLKIERLEAELSAEKRMTESFSQTISDLRKRLDDESKERRLTFDRFLKKSGI